MKDEIKEILVDLLFVTTLPNVSIKLSEEKLIQLKDYITNLQEENEKLKQKLNCKEYFSSTMPENTEFVILTKQNYDRQQKDIELELIDYKSRIENAIEYLELWHYRNDYRVNSFTTGCKNDLLNILQGVDNNEN